MKKVFTLNNVDVDDVCKRYGLPLSNLRDDARPDATTKVSDIYSDRITFTDVFSREHNCVLTMVGDGGGSLCFWCRSDVEMPIGCPIEWIPAKYRKEYYSEISKDTFCISEYVAGKRGRMVGVGGDYYETDGVFCSFNCALAWILDNKSDPLYENSETLLLKMLRECYPDRECSINEAPHWRLLKCFGGHLSIEEFRKNFQNISYEFKGMMRSVSFMYESNFKI